MAEQTDAATATAAFVAERMGLPGIGYEVALAATNKWRMREKCREAGIPLPRYRKVQMHATMPWRPPRRSAIRLFSNL